MQIEEHDLLCDDGKGGIDGCTGGLIAANIAEHVDGQARVRRESVGFDNGGAADQVIDDLHLHLRGIRIGNGQVLCVTGAGVALCQVPAGVSGATAHGGGATGDGSIETGGEEVLPLGDDGYASARRTTWSSVTA